MYKICVHRLFMSAVRLLVNRRLLRFGGVQCYTWILNGSGGHHPPPRFFQRSTVCSHGSKTKMVEQACTRDGRPVSPSHLPRYYPACILYWLFQVSSQSWFEQIPAPGKESLIFPFFYKSELLHTLFRILPFFMRFVLESFSYQILESFVVFNSYQIFHLEYVSVFTNQSPTDGHLSYF